MPEPTPKRTTTKRRRAPAPAESGTLVIPETLELVPAAPEPSREEPPQRNRKGRPFGERRAIASRFHLDRFLVRVLLRGVSTGEPVTSYHCPGCLTETRAVLSQRDWSCHCGVIVTLESINAAARRENLKVFGPLAAGLGILAAAGVAKLGGSGELALAVWAAVTVPVAWLLMKKLTL